MELSDSRAIRTAAPAPPALGDGIVWAGQEQCDDANADDDDACTNACTLGLCVNGVQNAGELGVDCGGPCPEQCLVINEVDYDQPGNLVDSATIAGSLSRIPNGIDTNQMSVDWKFVGTPTPGAANVP